MGRRTVLLIAALVVAALGVALVWMYADRADERAQAGAEQVQVLVATVGIPAGTSGSALGESVQLTTLPKASVPLESLSDLTPVADLVTIQSVFPGQVLLTPMFGTQAASGGGLELTDGRVAVSVSMGDPQRVAGFVSPGSEVAVFLTVAGAGGVEETQTAVLLERVQVIAVGPSTISSSTTTTDGAAGTTTNTEQIPTAILTLALTQDEAQRVIQGSTEGAMYFALVNDESEVDPDAPGTTTEIILD